MSKVYFSPIENCLNTDEICIRATKLFEMFLQSEQILLEENIPIKVHFGEKGNQTFVRPENFEGIIDTILNRNSNPYYIETNVLYQGQRMRREDHIKLAKEHGFDNIPIVIADGEYGNDFIEVEINQKHFETCKLGKAFETVDQMIVISHFKGHMLAGFGGAIKQLSMGCASRGGKLAMHANQIPRISSRKCTACGICSDKCPVDAIAISEKAVIDEKTCIGCASCIAVCPEEAISNAWLPLEKHSFEEYLAEYALAAHKRRKNLYITFAINITHGCDCESQVMRPIVQDLGIFASSDPIAIDKACLDMLDKREGRKVFEKGRRALKYGEKIGLGSLHYELIAID